MGEFLATPERRDDIPSLHWTRIVEARKRDRKLILPMSLVAAAGAWVWVGPSFALGWMAAIFCGAFVSNIVYRQIERRAAKGRGWETLVAAVSGLNTAIYCLLPAALSAKVAYEPRVTGIVMIGAVVLSAGEELVLSRRIALASLGVTMTASLMILIAQSDPRVWWHGVLAGAAIACFFAYAFDAAGRRARMEVRMVDALAAAQEKEFEAAVANAAKSTFLATISHEIRTPLNGVLGMAQAMEMGELNPEQRERLGVIRRSGQALTAVLNDVLDLSKIEAGQMAIEQVAFDLEEALRTCVGAFAARADEKGLGLGLELGAGASGAYRGDPTRLRQVIYNLVSNGVKFSSEGQVSVQAGHSAEGLTISVRDTGPGIRPEDQARLFQKFEQLDASTTRRHGGSGLGLAICRELCALMGGTIMVDSAPGQGSTFTVTLPFERIGEAAPSPAEADAGEGGAAAGLRILAAEDNEVNRRVLDVLLRPLEPELTLVADGQAALEAWAGGDWDLVLMDVHMPVMDGLAAVREMRAREAAQGRARTPVIALTANAMVHQVDEFLAAGMDDHVAKPIQVAELFAAIARHAEA